MPSLLAGFCLLAFFLTPPAFAKRSSLPSQFEATCYPKCRCNMTTIECRNTQETDTALFHKMVPIVYPNLDTIVVTGNDFGELPVENVFGNGNRHTKVTLINLSDDGISAIYVDTLVGVPNVNYLHLHSNVIEEAGVKPFNYLRHLKVLDLNAALATGLSAQKKADLVDTLLSTDHGFSKLEELILSGNGLVHFNPDVFCKTKFLGRLILSYNELTNFDVNLKCLKNIRLLDLRSNKLTTVPATLWNSLDALNTLDFSLNPLNCDCKLKEFIALVNEETSLFLNQQQTTCAAPDSLSGKSVVSGDVEDADVCEVQKPSGSWLHWLVLLCIAATAITAYCHLRRTSRLAQTSRAVFGYRKLRTADDHPQHVEPVFL